MRVLILLALCAALLAGCASPREASLYVHAWTYGPGYSPPGADPVFRDSFSADAGDLTVRIEWRVDAGSASVVLLAPDGADALNETSPPGGRGETETEASGSPGLWRIVIPTARGGDAAFPSGHIRVEVFA